MELNPPSVSEIMLLLSRCQSEWRTKTENLFPLIKQTPSSSGKFWLGSRATHGPGQWLEGRYLTEKNASCVDYTMQVQETYKAFYNAAQRSIWHSSNWEELPKVTQRSSMHCVPSWQSTITEVALEIRILSRLYHGCMLMTNELCMQKIKITLEGTFQLSIASYT